MNERILVFGYEQYSIAGSQSDDFQTQDLHEFSLGTFI